MNDIYGETIDEDENIFFGFEASLNSRWVAPMEDFQSFCNAHAVSIIGVSMEFSNDYCESFHIYPEN